MGQDFLDSQYSTIAVDPPLTFLLSLPLSWISYCVSSREEKWASDRPVKTNRFPHIGFMAFPLPPTHCIDMHQGNWTARLEPLNRNQWFTERHLSDGFSTENRKIANMWVSTIRFAIKTQMPWLDRINCFMASSMHYPCHGFIHIMVLKTIYIPQV